VVSSARTLVCAKMHEPVTVHALVQGLRVNAFTWLTLGDGPRVPPQEADKRRQLVEQFMFWLFEHVLIPLLRVRFPQHR
jgi:telomerase reverse transcriptase